MAGGRVNIYVPDTTLVERARRRHINVSQLFVRALEQELMRVDVDDGLDMYMAMSRWGSIDAPHLSMQ
jgi:hypothetical protein